MWLKQRITPAGAWFILVPLIVFLLNTSFQSFVETTTWTSATYLPLTPHLVVQFIFMMLIAYAVMNGLRTIAYISCMLLPVVVVLGDFVMSANLPHKNYSYLLPILENGWGGPLRGALYAFSCGMEVFLFMFVQHHMRSKIKFWQLFAFSAFIMLLMSGPTISAIAQFGPVEAEKLRFPAFAQWRLVSIGKYFEHVDFFAVFQWMSGAFIRASFGLVLILELIPIRGRKGRVWFMAVMSVIYIAAANFLEPLINRTESVTRIVFLVDMGLGLYVTTVIWLFSFSGLPKGREQDDQAQHNADSSERADVSNKL